MHLRIDPSAAEPIFSQIVSAVKRAAAEGRLRAGDRLPTVRELAAELVVNPNTVARAYQQLEAEGVTLSRRGAGTVLAERPSPLRADERQRRLRAAFDQALSEALHIGCGEAELRAAFDAALRRVRFADDRTTGTKGEAS